jgi:hypothetical protein
VAEPSDPRGSGRLFVPLDSLEGGEPPQGKLELTGGERVELFPGPTAIPVRASEPLEGAQGEAPTEPAAEDATEHP